VGGLQPCGEADRAYLRRVGGGQETPLHLGWDAGCDVALGVLEHVGVPAHCDRLQAKARAAWPGTRSPQRRVGRAATTPAGPARRPARSPAPANRPPRRSPLAVGRREPPRRPSRPAGRFRPAHCDPPPSSGVPRHVEFAPAPCRSCWSPGTARAAREPPRATSEAPPPPPVRWALRLVGMGNGTLDGCTVSIAPIEGFLCPLHTRRCDPRCPWRKTAVAGRSDGGPGTVAPQARSASAGAGVAHRDTDRSAGLGTVPVRRLSDDGPGTPPPRHRPLTEGRSSRPDVAPGSPSSREDHPFDHDGFPSGWSTPAAPRHTKCPPTVGHRADRRDRGRMSRLRFS